MSSIVEASLLPATLLSALRLLLQGRTYAKWLKGSLWDFPVELKEFEKAGCTPNDLRFLLQAGYIEQQAQSPEPQTDHPKTHLLIASARFVLSESGFKWAQQMGLCSAEKTTAERRNLKPHFRDSALCVGEQVIKWFRQRAELQEVVLQTFEDDGWPREIDDPLTGNHGIEPKRRLSQTVTNLNRAHQIALIRFYTSGSGERIGWQWQHST